MCMHSIHDDQNDDKLSKICLQIYPFSWAQSDFILVLLIHDLAMTNVLHFNM